MIVLIRQTCAFLIQFVDLLCVPQFNKSQNALVSVFGMGSVNNLRDVPIIQLMTPNFVSPNSTVAMRRIMV